MGDSIISFDEGTARNWAFWQRSVASNTVEEQKSVESEPFLPIYSISVTAAISAATANAHLLQIMGSTLNRVYLRRLTVTQMGVASANLAANFQLLRLTTAGTGGTSYTPVAVDPNDGNTTVAAMTLPSSKGTESSVLWTGVGSYVSALPATPLPPLLDLDWARQRTKGPIIAAGEANGIALKQITAITTTPTVHIYAEFAEAFWS